MTTNDTYQLVENADGTGKYKLKGHETPSNTFRTLRDNTTFGEISAGMRNAEKAALLAEVTNRLYASRGNDILVWLQDGAIGDPPPTLSWEQCTHMVEGYISDAIAGRTLGYMRVDDPKMARDIELLAGIGSRQTSEHAADTNTNYTLIEVDPEVPIRRKLLDSRISTVAKDTYTALRHPKEILESLVSRSQIDRILSADGKDYEWMLDEIRQKSSESYTDIFDAAIGRMLTDPLKYTARELCELYTAGRYKAYILDEEALKMMNLIFDGLLRREATNSDEAFMFLDQLCKSIPEDCQKGLEHILSAHKDDAIVVEKLSQYRDRLFPQNIDVPPAIVEDALAPDPVSSIDTIAADENTLS